MSLGRRLASQSALIFSIRIGGAGLVFLAQAAIARAWGAAVLGDYLLAASAANILGAVMPLGFQTIAPYFAAEYRAQQDGKSLRRFMARAYGHVVAFALALVLAGLAAARMLDGLAPVLAAYWPQVLLLATAAALIFVNGAVLVGLKRPLAGFLADALFRPLALIAGFAVALALGGGPQAGLDLLLWGLSALLAGVALVHFGFTMQAARTVATDAAPAAGETRRWWRFAVPWVLIGLATDFFFDLDLLLLSGLLDSETLAVFGVATRIFGLVSFGIAAVYAVTLPDMFEADAQADRSGFLRKVGDANLVASGLALVLILGAAVGAPLLFGLFGDDFAHGTGPLVILCLALLVRAGFGPAALVLSIHDRPYASLPAVGLGLVALVAGNAVLTPTFGLTGAALAALLAITLWSAALWLTARQLAGVDVSVWPRLRGMIAQKRVRGA